MRLINADELKDNLIRKYGSNYFLAFVYIAKLIDNAPTVEERPQGECKGCEYLKDCETCEDKAKQYSMGFQDGYMTGKARPQGEWIRTALYGQTCYECDNCHLHFDFGSNFCSNCGAEMRKGGAE